MYGLGFIGNVGLLYLCGYGTSVSIYRILTTVNSFSRKKAHYYFDERYGHMDQTRKEAFREATAVYHRRTCIRFVEVESNFTGVTLRVGNYNSGSCWASYLGYPSSGTSSDFRRSGFNLGSCMNLNHMGEILHNLGHVLGMLDEQNRPDATRVYHGHGPHLRVFWDNLPNSWSFLFSEVGVSQNRGPYYSTRKTLNSRILIILGGPFDLVSLLSIP